MVEKCTSVRFDVADGKEQLKTLIEKVEEMGLKAQRAGIHNSLNPWPTKARVKKGSALHGSAKCKKEAEDKLAIDAWQWLCRYHEL